jgi:hypothetical protein
VTGQQWTLNGFGSYRDVKLGGTEGEREGAVSGDEGELGGGDWRRKKGVSGPDWAVQAERGRWLVGRSGPNHARWQLDRRLTSNWADTKDLKENEAGRKEVCAKTKSSNRFQGF